MCIQLARLEPVRYSLELTFIDYAATIRCLPLDTQLYLPLQNASIDVAGASALLIPKTRRRRHLLIDNP